MTQLDTAKRIKKAIEKSGMLQREAASRIGYSRGGLTNALVKNKFSKKMLYALENLLKEDFGSKNM
jgi:DNA transposition AAA+ family ATPase